MVTLSIGQSELMTPPLVILCRVCVCKVAYDTGHIHNKQEQRRVRMRREEILQKKKKKEIANKKATVDQWRPHDAHASRVNSSFWLTNCVCVCMLKIVVTMAVAIMQTIMRLLLLLLLASIMLREIGSLIVA